MMNPMMNSMNPGTLESTQIGLTTCARFTLNTKNNQNGQETSVGNLSTINNFKSSKLTLFVSCNSD